MTKKKEIQLLQKQIEKLKAEDFDLEAWKSSAIIILERIFGVDNQKIRQIENVKYDQSSWALREAKGSKNMMDTCKKQGKEIFQISIDELELFGLPEDLEEAQSAPFKSVIIQALENELKIAEYKKVVSIIKADMPIEEKKNKLIDALSSYSQDFAESMLMSILLAKQTKQYL